jgi:hypothetical protein
MAGDVGGSVTRPTGSGNGTDGDHHSLDRSRAALLFACARALMSTTVRRLPHPVIRKSLIPSDPACAVEHQLGSADIRTPVPIPGRRRASALDLATRFASHTHTRLTAETTLRERWCAEAHIIAAQTNNPGWTHYSRCPTMCSHPPSPLPDLGSGHA